VQFNHVLHRYSIHRAISNTVSTNNKKRKIREWPRAKSHKVRWCHSEKLNVWIRWPSPAWNTVHWTMEGLHRSKIAYKLRDISCHWPYYNSKLNLSVHIPGTELLPGDTQNNVQLCVVTFHCTRTIRECPNPAKASNRRRRAEVISREKFVLYCPPDILKLLLITY